jgi:hypothetical protein
MKPSLVLVGGKTQFGPKPSLWYGRELFYLSQTFLFDPKTLV